MFEAFDRFEGPSRDQCSSRSPRPFSHIFTLYPSFSLWKCTAFVMVSSHKECGKQRHARKRLYRRAAASKYRPETADRQSKHVADRHGFKEPTPKPRGCSLAMDPHLVYRVTSTLPIPTQGIPTAASINPEGSFIAVGSADGHVIIWCSRSYELFCQTSPLVGECGSTGARVVNMTWVTNELLAFSRRNGLMSVLLVGKVRESIR